MNASDLSVGQRDCGKDAGAYVLGALEPTDAQAFRRHLTSCVVCREEVTSLEAVVQALPMAAPRLPVPRRLRRRVLADVRAAPRASGGARPATGRLAQLGSGLRIANARTALTGAAALAAIAALALAVALSGGTSTHGRLVRASVSAPAASAVVRLQAGRGELIVRGMAAAPRGEIYEVWLKRGGHAPDPTSALFDVTSAGKAAVDVPGDLHGVRELLVTLERRGGSLRPTRKPVIVARLA
jgi:anti-sigma-K factor RskA